MFLRSVGQLRPDFRVGDTGHIGRNRCDFVHPDGLDFQNSLESLIENRRCRNNACISTLAHYTCVKLKII